MQKRRGNIIDIGILILIIVMVFAIRARFQKFNSSSAIEASSEKIEYEILISDIREYTADAFVEGDTIFDSQTNVCIGTITAKEKRHYQDESTLSDGTIVKREQPEKYEILLTVETDGIINKTGYYANKSVELKVGSEKIVETLYAKSTGRIKAIRVQE